MQLKLIYLNMDIYIKDVIKAKGLQLQQVAEKIGYKSLPSFYRQINTPESVSMKTLIKIADAIGCSVNDFFTNPELTNEQGNIIICPHCGKTIKFEKGE
nr:MAG TPA: helix-turn-helix domain protein [Caudoviricetes sp.]